MRNSALVVAMIGAASIGATASARDFEVVTAGDTANTTIGTVEVTVAPDIVEPQNRLRARRLNELETIGPRDAEEVVDVVGDAIRERLERSGAYDPNAPDAATLNVIVTKAKPSNLQFTEYGIANNLAFNSVAAGGAAFHATLVGADGATLAEYEYSWFEPHLDLAFPPIGTWYDLRRASYWFANHVGEELETEE